MSVRQLGYIRFEASSLDDWEDFLGDLLDGARVLREGDQLLLQVDSMFARLIIEQGPADDMTALGWEVTDHRSLAAVAERAEAAGFAVKHATDAERAAGKVLGLIFVDDPSGIRNEIFYGPIYDDQRTLERSLAGRFLAGSLGAGHAAVFCDPADYDACVNFYRDVLELAIVGRREVEDLTMGIPITMYRCNRRQHSLGLVPMVSPTGKRLAHCSVEYMDIDDLGRAHDAAVERDIVMMSLGRHQADGTVSFYAKTPAGFEMEIGWDSRLVPEDMAIEQYRPVRGPSVWGHKRESF
ncbi:MAG TPA: VOC family protein [Baekduia sp.]|nr:VOC family protein [Baekduia sp.]